MILYINGNYPHHSLHGELVSRLADLENEICVYVPTRSGEQTEEKHPDNNRVSVIYSRILNKADRLLFIPKVHKLIRDIESKVDMEKVTCILAGTLYSDGYPAYLLSRKYHIPFTVAVRETDVSIHMKYRRYLNGMISRELSAASKVIFLSPVYRDKLSRFGDFTDKFVDIPNGVNDFWFANHPKERSLHSPVSLVYVGEISRRKNLQTSIRVVERLRRDGLDVVFHVVGSGKMEAECKQLAHDLGIADCIRFHGWKNTKAEIKQIYDISDIFIMPSYTETFGTVYIEALSQGLPVIYTKGQGIDGYFEQGEVGYACGPMDVNGMADAVRRIIADYSAISERCIELSGKFQWNETAAGYNDLFNGTGN